MLATQYLKVLGIALMVVAGVPQVKAQVPAPVTNGDIAPPRMIAGNLTVSPPARRPAPTSSNGAINR